MKAPSTDQLFDELLVLSHRAGDAKAMELLIRRWNKRIVSYAYRQTHDQEVARDIAQEVWITALQKMSALQDAWKVGSWLLSIAHNKSIDWIRRESRGQEHKNSFSEGAQGQDELDDSDNDSVNRIRVAIGQLSAEHRNIITLFYLEGFSINEIAEIMKLSKGTIKSRLYYARQTLKTKLNR